MASCSRSGYVYDGQRFHDERLIAYRHCDAFGPAAGDVGERQGMDEVTAHLGATAVFDHVDFEEARRRVSPVGKGANRNAAPDGCIHACSALALAVGADTRGGQGAVDGGSTDLHEPGADIRVKLQMTVPLHGNDEDRDERLQALAADAVACLPQHDQRLPYRFVVHAVPRRSRRLR